MFKYSVAIVIILLLFSCKVTSLSQTQIVESDCLIDTIKIKEFVTFLNQTIPEYEEKRGEKFLFDKKYCFTKRFYIHDLTNSEVINNVLNKNDFILENNHIYHFYALDDELSFSHIAYIDEKGNITFFESINCKDRGNTLQDVLNFLESKFSANPNKKEILERVKNYRKYFISGSIDNIKVQLKCDCETPAPQSVLIKN